LLPADEFRRLAAGCSAILCHLTDAIDEALLAAAGPQLQVVANYAVGYNNIDLDACRRHRVLATNTPGVLTEATADIAFALLLAASRRLVEGDALVRSGEWRGWAPRQLLGGDLHGRTLGLVGCGRIGQAVARRAQGFGLRLIYHQPKPLPSAAEQELRLDYRSLPKLLAEADFVSLHCPLTPATHHLLGAAEFARMKPTAYLINTARGPVVDEAALAAALQAGRLAGAGLDVYEKEPEVHPGLAELPNVVLLPHLGSATLETRTRMGELAVANVLAGLRGEQPPHELTGAKR